MFMQRYSRQLYALLRIIAGFLFLWHGSQKLFDFPPAPGQMPGYIVAVAGPIEFVGGLLILIGLWTHYVAFITAGEMAYAYWTAHGPHAALPLVNHGELAVLYCFLWLYMSAHGAGIWSIDNLTRRRRAT